MNKEIETKEMLRALYRAGLMSETYNKAVANVLYEDGYRKINAAYVTEESIKSESPLEDLPDIVVLSAQVQVLESEKENLERTLEETGEALKNVLQELYDKCFELKYPYIAGSDEIKGCVTADDILWYAKEMGVEIEE